MDFLPELGEAGLFDELVWYTPLLLEFLMILGVVWFVVRKKQWSLKGKIVSGLGIGIAGTVIVVVGYMLVVVLGLTICCP